MNEVIKKLRSTSHCNFVALEHVYCEQVHLCGFLLELTLVAIVLCAAIVASAAAAAAAAAGWCHCSVAVVRAQPFLRFNSFLVCHNYCYYLWIIECTNTYQHFRAHTKCYEIFIIFFVKSFAETLPNRFCVVPQASSDSSAFTRQWLECANNVFKRN